MISTKLLFSLSVPDMLVTLIFVNLRMSVSERLG